MRIADMSLCPVLLSHVCSGDSSCLAALLARFLLSAVMLLPNHFLECFVMPSLVLLTHAYAGPSLLSCRFFRCCYLSWSLCALYLLCISLGEGQLGGHMEHDFLLSVNGVDRLRTSLTMWHIQTSSKPARGWRQQNTCTNPPDLKILQHKRPWFDSQLDKEGSGYRNIDNGVWMCILVLLGGSLKGPCLTPWSPAAPPCLPTAAGSPWKPAFLQCSWTAPPQTPVEQVRHICFTSISSITSESGLFYS